MLYRRSYSVGELREKLVDIASPEEIDEILEECKRRKYVNDRVLAAFLSEKYLKKSKGFFYILAILEKRKIPDDIIKEVRENFDFNREFKIARDFFLKNRKRKKISYLIFSLKSRGFSYPTINRLMNTLVTKVE